MKYDDAKKEFIGIIEYQARKYQKWQVFGDFCYLAAISIKQPFAFDEELEKEYLKTINRYTKEEANIFPKLLSLVVLALSDRFGDFMGECFMGLELGNKYKGQFFTPYHISKFMSQILGEQNNKEIEIIGEPACGAGGMIIARAEAMMEENINYQKKMIVQAIDVEFLCVMMSYIQFSLLNIQAEVIHGNSLSLEAWSVWRTPAYYMNASHRYLYKPKEERERVSLPKEQEPHIYTREQIKVFNSGRLF